MKKQEHNKSIAIRHTPTDIVLGERYDVGEDHENYKVAKGIKTVAHEKVKIVNPITKRKATVELSRTGTSEQALGSLMLSPDATREQKDSMIAQYLFEQGRENGSFLAELFVSKGTLTKQTQVFKSQMRFDFENFATIVTLLFQDMAKDINRLLDSQLGSDETFQVIANHLEAGAELITNAREKITLDRMREKGYGVYIDNNGKAYSIHEDEIESAVKKDKESLGD